MRWCYEKKDFDDFINMCVGYGRLRGWQYKFDGRNGGRNNGVRSFEW